MREKVLLSVGSGVLTALTALVVNAASLQFERALVTRQLVGDVVAGLVTMLAALAIQLRYEGMYFRFAMDRAAIIAELNHHVRNAVFPLCLAVQRSGDNESKRLASDSVDRINTALRDAMADAFTRNVDYLGPQLLRPTKDVAA